VVSSPESPSPRPSRWAGYRPLTAAALESHLSTIREASTPTPNSGPPRPLAAQQSFTSSSPPRQYPSRPSPPQITLPRTCTPSPLRRHPPPVRRKHTPSPSHNSYKANTSQRSYTSSSSQNAPALQIRQHRAPEVTQTRPHASPMMLGMSGAMLGSVGGSTSSRL
jgi:hypothetical protein